MSDLKHVQLTTISDIKKANGGSESGNKSKESKTIRLELSLFDPTADSFPEFNYAKLIHSEKVSNFGRPKQHTIEYKSQYSQSLSFSYLFDLVKFPYQDY